MFDRALPRSLRLRRSANRTAHRTRALILVVLAAFCMVALTSGVGLAEEAAQPQEAENSADTSGPLTEDGELTVEVREALEAGGDVTPEVAAELSNFSPRSDAESTHSVLLGARIIHIPSGLLDIYLAEHANTWDKRSNFGYGVDYLWRLESFEVQGGVYFLDTTMPDGYWLEAGKEENPSAADFVRQDVSAIVIEGSVFGYYDFTPEVGMFYGGGAWFGPLIGDVVKANIDAECSVEVRDNGRALGSCPTDEFFEEDQNVPAVVGFASVSAGFRFELAERFVVRLEGGFKGYVFGGLSIGAQFW